MADIELRADDRKFYAGSVDYFDAENQPRIKKHLEVVKAYIGAVADSLDAFYRRRNGNVRFVELGAGTCLTSLSLRKMYPQASFTCADISMSRMKQLLGKSAGLVGVDGSGIQFSECDMSNELPFGDAQFDVVVFDASLHHSRNIWLTLGECRRILARDDVAAGSRHLRRQWRFSTPSARRPPVVSGGALGLAVVVQNIFTSLFNSHLFDFQ